MRKRVDNDMNSAKFIAVCFALMTLITISVVPVLSAVSAMFCAGVGARSYSRGITSKQYAFSALVLFVIAIRTAWVMQ